MKTVLIADDELLARLGIKSLLNWEELGYQIIHESENGLDALNYAKKFSPDIIITDVKMPVMDGISLIKKLKEEKISSKIIVMSAYGDFTYVKNAMRDGADDYLLKLELEADSLLETLQRVSKKIDQEFKEKYSQKTPVKDRETFTFEEILQLLSEQKINEIPTTFVSTFEKNAGYLFSYIKFIPKNFKNQNWDGLLLAIRDMIQKAILNFGQGTVFCVKKLNFGMILCLKEQDISNINFLLSHLAENIRQMGSMLFNLNCYFGFGKPVKNPLKISESRDYAKISLQNACFSKITTCIYFPEKTESIDFSKILVTSLSSIESAIQTMDLQLLSSSFGELLKKIDQEQILNQKYLNSICHTLIFLGNKLSAKIGEPIWNPQDDPYETLKFFEVREQYTDWICSLRDQFFKLINPESENQRIIMEAKKCIQKNYSKDISLNFVADYLGLSPNYFSRLFKKHTGQGFIDYLTNVRIHQAMELLQSGKYKVYEVSEMVGYENATYFSQIFKKKTGKSPYQIKSIL